MNEPVFFMNDLFFFVNSLIINVKVALFFAGVLLL